MLFSNHVKAFQTDPWLIPALIHSMQQLNTFILSLISSDKPCVWISCANTMTSYQLTASHVSFLLMERHLHLQ